jgi:hypothetical protein
MVSARQSKICCALRVQNSLVAGPVRVTDTETGRQAAWWRVSPDAIELHTRPGGSYRIAR